jgi:hypothetical protein
MTQKGKGKGVYSDSDGIVCKGCHTIHIFDDMDMRMRGPVLFPNDDFSIYKVICPKNDQYYEYAQKDVLRHKPPSDSGSSDEISVLKDRTKALESRLAILESGKWMEERKQELQDFVRVFLKEQLKQVQPEPRKVATVTS